MLLTHRIQSYFEHNIQIAGYHTALAVDGFTLYVHKTDPGFDANVIFPAAGTVSVGNFEQTVEQLSAVCAQHQRVPHFRFLDQAAPGLQNRLEASGFRREKAMPILLVTSASMPDPQPMAGVSVDVLTQQSPLDDVRMGLNVNALGFDPNAPLATDEEAYQFRAGLVASRAFTLRYRNEPVAAGMYTPIHARVTELVGITTLEPFRRRGFARYLTAYMACAALQAGADLVFLAAVSGEATRVYRQAGFELCTERLSYGAVSHDE